VAEARGTASFPRFAGRALLAGLALFVLLFPWGGGISTDPPTCYGVFGPFWMVPCEGGIALAAAGFVAGAVLLASAVARDRMVWPTKIALATLAGLTMAALQIPSLVIDTNPQVCISNFGHWTVPCGEWPPVAMGAVTGMVVLLALSLDELRR
jgi:hypothetical protein